MTHRSNLLYKVEIYELELRRFEITKVKTLETLII